MQELLKAVETVLKIANELTESDREDMRFNALQGWASSAVREAKEELNRRKAYAHNVKDMRRAQMEYFKLSKAKNWIEASKFLKISKVHEGDVDRKTVEIITGAAQAKMF